MSPLPAPGRRGLLRRAAALLLFLIAADVLLSFIFWRAAGEHVGSADISAFCAPEAQTRPAIAVFYSDDAALRQERLGKASELARACRSAPVLLVGGARPHRGYFGSEEMAGALEAMGVEKRRLRIGRASYDTRTNLRELQEMAAAERADRLALVSDALHLFRIRALFADPPGGAELFGFPAAGDAGLMRIVWRANYEAAAWLGMLAPEALRDFVYEKIGRRRGDVRAELDIPAVQS